MIHRVLIGAAIVGLVLANIWLHAHIVTLGYEIEQARQQKRELLQVHRQLLIELETLSALDRIREIAMGELGMVRPREDQVILVGEEPPGPSSPEQNPGPHLVKKEP